MRTFVFTASLAAISCAIATPSFAQQAGAAFNDEEAAPSDAARGGDFDAIIVTSRVGGSELRKAEASYAITTLGDETLRLTNPVSVADTFKQVPGFWVESSGGEGSNNVRSRGIPTDGYSSVALQETPTSRSASTKRWSG
jgi:hypothetical protein